jgi:lipopolysaccharide export system protein LptC
VNKKNLFITIILLAIFSTASIVALMAAKRITIANPNATNTPDFFITNAVYIKFDQNGNISDQFYTGKIAHFTDHNNYIFDNPRIRIHNPGEQPWNITADKGRSEGGKSKIYLWDNVKVTQVASQNNADFDINTNALTVFLDIKFAQTDKPITIIQGGSVLNAIGAKANFKSGTVELLSNVECQYQTN